MSSNSWNTWASQVLRLLIVGGIILVIVGPCNYMLTEGGGGDSLPPLQETLRARRLAYILVGAGAITAIGSAVILVIIERHHSGGR